MTHRNIILPLIALLPLLSCDVEEVKFEGHLTNREEIQAKRNPAIPELYTVDIKHYYGLDILNQDDSRLREFLMLALNKSHIKQDRTFDKLVDKCEPAEKSQCYSYQFYNYRDARKILFGTIHLDNIHGKNSLRELYCGRRYFSGDIIQGHLLNFEQDSIPNSNVINTEHVWPKSRFDNTYDMPQTYEHSERVMKTDLHHLFPTDYEINHARSYYYFADVDTEIEELKCNGARLGKLQNIDEKRKNYIFFQPPDEVKGDIARALFYFATRYERPIINIEEKFLRKWHEEDPVSQIERKRNFFIHQYQGVRNPYIDYPQLVKRIKDF